MTTLSQKSSRFFHVLAVAGLIVILLVGLCTYRDYGLTFDERVERFSSIVNYQYILQKLFGLELRVIDKDLWDWTDQYYGVAFQLPMVLVEHINHFSMPQHEVFVMRHLMTFLLCWCGWVCLYVFLQKVFQDRFLSFIGLLMVVLYPRFWGEQFNNIKDMVFTANCCVALMMITLCLEKRRWWKETLTALVFALCINTRVVGLMFPLLLMGYRVLAAIFEKKEILREALLSLGQVALTLAFYFALTPAAWEDPIHFLPNVIQNFSHFEAWGGSIPFLGSMIPGQQVPWYYIPVWLLVSLPIWYVGLLTVGLGTEGFALISMLRRGKGKQWFASQRRYGMLCFVVAFAPIGIMLFKQVTLYNGWRHMYYIFPCLVTLMLFGVQSLGRALEKKKALRRMGCGVIAALLLFQAGWIWKEHPYEKVYFNPIGKTLAEGMDRDYWGESLYRQFQYILQNDPSNQIKILDYNGCLGIYRSFLTEEEKARVEMVPFTGSVAGTEAEYLIDLEDTVIPEDFGGAFVKIRTVYVDGVAICNVYIRRDVLTDRFGMDEIKEGDF